MIEVRRVSMHSGKAEYAASHKRNESAVPIWNRLQRFTSFPLLYQQPRAGNPAARKAA